MTTKLWLSGALQGTGESMNTVVSIILRLTEGGQVQTAEVEIDAAALEKIRQARIRP